MEDRNIFTKMAKKVLQSHQGVRGPKAIHPARDWLIGLFLASVILVVSVVLAIYEYKLYRDITVTDYSSTEEVVIYRANMVNDALLKFTERDEEHRLLINQNKKLTEEESSTETEESEVDMEDSLEESSELGNDSEPEGEIVNDLVETII